MGTVHSLDIWGLFAQLILHSCSWEYFFFINKLSMFLIVSLVQSFTLGNKIQDALCSLICGLAVLKYTLGLLSALFGYLKGMMISPLALLLTAAVIFSLILLFLFFFLFSNSNKIIPSFLLSSF